MGDPEREINHSYLPAGNADQQTTNTDLVPEFRLLIAEAFIPTLSLLRGKMTECIWRLTQNMLACWIGVMLGMAGKFFTFVRCHHRFPSHPARIASPPIHHSQRQDQQSILHAAGGASLEIPSKAWGGAYSN